MSSSSFSSVPEGLPESYSFVRRQLEVVGNREPREVLAETPELIESLVAGHDSQTFRREGVAGKWTPNEILGHLVDLEWVFGFRLRHVLCDSSVRLAPVDQDRWVREQRHLDREPRDLAASFRSLRSLNLLFWQDVEVAALDRSGVHEEAGVAYSLRLMLRLQAGHDLVHVQQLVDTLDCVAVSQGSSPC